MDWRLFVNLCAGILGLSYIVHFWWSKQFPEFRGLSILYFLAIFYYTVVYGMAIANHLEPTNVTILLRPFTGILLFLLGLHYYNLRRYYTGVKK